MSDFFQYHCDSTGKPFCERIHIMNLALDLVDHAFCLEVLAQTQDMEPKAFYDRMVQYIDSRECFKTPWDNFDPTPCPRIEDQTCFCQPIAWRQPKNTVTEGAPHDQ